MTLVTIGRFGQSFDVDANAWDLDGDQVKASGYIGNTDRALLALARQQIVWLAPPETDEQGVPVTFSSDATQDGYYRVVDCSVPMDVGRYTAKSLPWSASLVRVPHFQRPQIQVFSLGAVRGNVDSFIAGNVTPTVGYPGSLLTVTGATSSVPTSYASNNGDVKIDSDAAYHGTAGLESLYRVAPTAYYNGSVSVEQKIGGTWYPIVGREVKADAVDVRVNNGLIRLAAYTDGTATSSGIQIESVYSSGTLWGAVKTFNFRRSGNTLVTSGAVNVEILRNKPEECGIRLLYPCINATRATTLTVDITLRRGMRMADITMQTPTSTQWLVRSTIAMTATTGGYEATSNDANSQKHVFARRAATTLTGSNLDISYDAAATKSVFGLGVRETGGGTLWGTAADTMARWFGYVGTIQTVFSTS
jgi:hypothetical protein